MGSLSGDKGEKAIALVLRYGALVSTLIMALGIAVTLLRGPAGSLAASHRLRPALLLSQLMRLDAAAVTEVGVLLLLLTPIVRIVAAVVTFAIERDTRYVLISLGVLAVISLSIGFAAR